GGSAAAAYVDQPPVHFAEQRHVQRLECRVDQTGADDGFAHAEEAAVGARRLRPQAVIGELVQRSRLRVNVEYGLAADTHVAGFDLRVDRLAVDAGAPRAIGRDHGVGVEVQTPGLVRRVVRR